MTLTLTADDTQELARRGVTRRELERQLRILGSPPPPIRLSRPCTLGDGVTRIPPELHPELLALHRDAAASGRISKFVPASGAASRMFQGLASFVSERPDATEDEVRRCAREDAGAADLASFIEGLPRFAFRPALAAALRDAHEDLDDLLSRGEWGRIASAVVASPGLSLGARPKGLIEFHSYESGPLTPLEEHLVEAALTVRDGSGSCRVHLTAGPEHVGIFQARLDEILGPLSRALECRFDVRLTTQSPSTDTVAIDSSGELFRKGDGGILFRPGGHGALIENLERTEGDVVCIKNVDNVVHQSHAVISVLWKKLLSGFLLRLERDPAFQRERGDRPLRVCGVVPNEGEPGGGPFWVEGRHGARPQIVESSQVDSKDPAQQAILRSSTHFNPVDLVCSLRDSRGAPYPLREFVDPETVFLARKVSEGRPLEALERPGLWNGAMAGWQTVFVEMPKETFAPVKTVLDLLRPLHQPAE